MDDGRGRKFGTVAEQYDRFRPDPPDGASSLVGDLTGLSVLEVGAGTGKLTRFLLTLGANVSVIEPDEDMRRILERRSPGARVLRGHAEAVPALDGSFDAVFSSSAWHWFTQPDATNELARVLRDNGTLYVWWNGFSIENPWMTDFVSLRESPSDLRVRERGRRVEFDPDGPFVDARDFALEWTWPRTIDEVVGVFETYSGVIMQSDEERRSLERTVRERLTERFAGGDIELEMTLRGTSARRRPR
ncbi:MAG: class I SAM-dependent methyltransferase [Acidimicrobiales bacterium]